ncbi:hypothetical protein OIT41_20160 (plasmid) [Arthrobacter sp. YA7-1]|uniref:hypothetical protein n=1 Tax=Arthrobacter sp. YA7-1 TaxID=2987701 RepID=UPI002225EC33|nr:hypothetical protein [Arthrobacter sp. YA7-1]UYY83569.1 hypothetical protein OIT41_20160 [Arthrobacter sp. YA7-1]
MKVYVRLQSPDNGGGVLLAGRTLRIGSDHDAGGVPLIAVSGRRRLSRRALEMFNTGSKLVISSHQQARSSTVAVIDRTGGKGRQTLGRRPLELRPRFDVEIAIEFRDAESARIRIRAFDDGGAPLPEFTDPNRDVVDENEELLLLVNAIAIVAESAPGKLPAPTRVQEAFLPAVGKSVHSSNTFRKATERLAGEYGLRDPRALADMLERGLLRGHVTEAMKARVRKAGDNA